MDNYTYASLIKIDEDKVVVINGEEYLMVDFIVETPKKPKPKPRAKSKKTEISRDELKDCVVRILKKEDLSNGQIREILKSRFGVTITTPSLTYCLRSMRDDGLVNYNGSKRSAIWHVV